ncbi:MAG: phosphopyruvate hydratase, partial [Candidatus Saccharimonadia bacterium]
MDIKKLISRMILDSRGNPTVEVELMLTDGSMGRASVPSGASTGKQEALELRDDGTAYDGKGVNKALAGIKDIIAPKLMGFDATKQFELDNALIELDGTPNKARLGANAILGVSLAAAKAVAVAKQLPLYRYIGELAGNSEFNLPRPMCNIINGGRHAAGSTDIQEFMIVPSGADFPKQLETCVEIFHELGRVLSAKGYTTTVGDEGGYAPAVKHGNVEALELIMSAITNADYIPGQDVSLALDVAASELVSGTGYLLATENKTITSDELINWYGELSARFPIISIEDGLGEDD